MAWRRSIVLVLLATLAVGCSTPEAGTAVVGPILASSSTAVTTTAAASTPPASPTVAASSTMITSSASSTAAPSTAVTTATASTPASASTPTPTSTSTSTAAGSTTPESRIAATTPVSTTTPVAPFPLCPKVSPTDARAIVGCLRTSLSTFWSAQLNEVVDQPVVVEPTTAQVPQQCRSAITTTSAFTCQVDNTVYLNTGLLDAAKKDFAPGEVPYVFATVMGHEIGHVVQAAVQQPGYTDTGQSEQISQRIEQQADCLDGVWAHSLIAARQLDQATFVRVTTTFITSISTNPEIAGHGTPPQRAAALAKGLKNGRPQDCGLATFS